MSLLAECSCIGCSCAHNQKLFLAFVLGQALSLLLVFTIALVKGDR